MYSFVPIDRVQRMKLFESEGWKSFRLNSLAVILGVVITFGGGRLITNCQKRQDAREIVGLFKSDVLRHLDMSEGLLDDFTTGISACGNVPSHTAGRGKLKTRFCALGLFSPCAGMHEDIRPSRCALSLFSSEVVESVTKIGNVLTFWRQQDKMDETAPVLDCSGGRRCTKH